MLLNTLRSIAFWTAALFAVVTSSAAAQEAQRKAKREARKELHNARVAQRKEEAHAKVEELKSKLGGPKAGASA